MRHCFFKKAAAFFLLGHLHLVGTPPSNTPEEGTHLKRQAEQKKAVEEIPPTEDLMREHGILNRILLIYEEIIRRIDKKEFSVPILTNTAHIIQEFIENYHEKLEEEYIFPLFEHHKKSLKLVHTLREQHNKGRQITKVVLELSQSTDPKNTKKIQSLLKKFIKMYRPHEAREDTVLFPQVRSLLSTKQFDELGEKFEELEHKLFGKHGFESVVKKVEAIEKELDIYRLEKFTPR